MNERDAGLLWDIVQAANWLVEKLQDVTVDQFLADDVLHYAVANQTQTIGEAASRLSDEFRQATPDVPWGKIIGMRHKLVHDYRDRRLDVLWSSVREDLPGLIARLEPLIPPPPSTIDDVT